jgi:hypothetical protein
VVAILGLDPHAYRPHSLHSPERLFQETNCYTDLWVELLHAHGHEPLAVLAYCAVVDFEGDQWTFFKPPPEDLLRLYGIEVQEFVVYRPLPDHIAEQTDLGRTVIVEVDSYYLPDTAGRSYREKHEKSSIAIDSIDTERERAVYFHGPGLHRLDGDDFRNAFRVGRSFSPDVLAPYIELVRSDRVEPTPVDEQRAVAADLLRLQLARRPRTNPVRRFGERLEADLPRLLGDAPAFHEYAFVTVRQCGAAWEAAESFLVWLDGGSGAYADAATGFGQLALGAKTLLFKLARSAAKGAMLDTSAPIDELAEGWEQALAALDARVA